MAGQRPKLGLERVDPLGQAGQGIAAGRVCGAGQRRLIADLGLDVAVGEDPALDRAQLLLEPVDPPFDRLRLLRLGRRLPAQAGEQDQPDQVNTHLIPRMIFAWRG